MIHPDEDGLSALMDAAVRRKLDLSSRALEQACEAAIQGGESGVRHISHRDGSETFEVHPSVPYGMIYHYPQGMAS